MDFEMLHQLCDLKYRNSQQKLAVIVERENALRAELAKLRGFVTETRSLPAEQAQMRAIGADVIWMQWVARSQSRLNIELAQVLAQKEGLIVQHKRAFGKTHAAQSLANEAKQKRVRHLRERMLTQAIAQSLTR